MIISMEFLNENLYAPLYTIARVDVVKKNPETGSDLSTRTNKL